MKSKAIRIWVYLLGILPLIVLGCVYSHLPQEVPLHWNFDGSVDYGNKVQLWILFSLGLIFAVMFDVLPKIDPKRENFKRFGKQYDVFVIFMSLFLMTIEGITLVESFRPNTIRVDQAVIILVGVLFIVTGNMLPKIKPNFSMGIKTPWTISDPDVWNKTHRLGGRLMFIEGILCALCGLFASNLISMIVIIAGAIVITVIPLVMSYVWYRNKVE